ncbi:MAG: tetratricopeptide repeat protein, partial [Planctomycetota bacterium]|nr:tetratricopeptide repeat protein [Planctomycetota bacterium]
MFFDEFEKSVMEYKKLAIVNPVGKWKYYFAIGDFFASQGQMPEAAAFWGRVAERAFTDANLYLRLATRYYWAGRPQRAVRLLRKAISIYPDDYRYYLVLGNMLALEGDYEHAISSYRDALQRSVQTMLLPVRRTMSRTQVKFAHRLYQEGKYEQALEVYREIRRFQEVMNKHLGTTVPEYPDILVQILRTEARLAGKPTDKAALMDISGRFPDAQCWVSDHLQMTVEYFAALESSGAFDPNLAILAGKTERKLNELKVVYSVRTYPWILQAKVSPSKTYLMRRYTRAIIDTKTGKLLEDGDRYGRMCYFGNHALRIGGGKLRLSEIESGKQLWEVEGNWSPNARANSNTLVGHSGRGGRLQALDHQTGKQLWQGPSCEKFRLDGEYVSLKRVKKWVGRTGGLEDHAHGDTDSIGYFFQILNARTGEVVMEQSSSGSHYWRVPVVAGDLALLTDGFAHKVHAHDIATGKLRWTALFDSFFAREPLLVDGK